MDFRTEFAEALEAVPEEFFDTDRFVPGVGSLDAEIMLVGEAPGANEVEEGEPFVGRAGKRLNEVLRSLGVSRSEIYITNLVKVRPPDNRDPKRDEIDAWKPVLDAEIDRINPKTIVPLGNFASRELTGRKEGITKLHGKKFTVDGRTVMPAYHPAATLYDNSKTPALEKDIAAAFGKRQTGQKGLTDF